MLFGCALSFGMWLFWIYIYTWCVIIDCTILYMRIYVICLCLSVFVLWSKARTPYLEFGWNDFYFNYLIDFDNLSYNVMIHMKYHSLSYSPYGNAMYAHHGLEAVYLSVGIVSLWLLCALVSDDWYWATSTLKFANALLPCCSRFDQNYGLVFAKTWQRHAMTLRDF